MAEQIKELITKIQREGIKAGEDKARDIEQGARLRAQAIVAEAQEQAQRLIAAARAEVAKMEKNARSSLEQAGRDLLLSLREEINAMLNKLLISEARKALGPDELSKIITSLIKEVGPEQRRDLVVSLSQEDLKKLEKGILHKLHAETKKGITLRPSGEITGCFTISYDGGKSHYDFTDKGIAEYLSIYLKPRLAEILATSIKKK